MIDEVQALRRYRQALSLVEAKGALVTVGVTTFKEWRTTSLTIRLMPTQGRLDIWDRRKVLTVDRWRGGLRVITYTRGDWEDELEEEATNSAPHVQPDRS